MIPVTVDDLAANGLLGEAAIRRSCWERSVETLTARKDDIAGLAVASDERIEAYILYVTRSGRDGDCVAPLFRRGRWSPSEATALSTPRARHDDLPVPEGPPGGDLEGAPGDARFPPRRRASTLRREGAVRLAFRIVASLRRRFPANARAAPTVTSSSLRSYRLALEKLVVGSVAEVRRRYG